MELKSLKDTQKLSKKLSKKIKPGDIIFLYGEIGVGKTTFVRFLINQLEVKNKINKSEILSPTFNIVYDYKVKKLNILHYDLYRLKNNKDILELGMFETSKNYIKKTYQPATRDNYFYVSNIASMKFFLTETMILRMSRLPADCQSAASRLPVDCQPAASRREKDIK